MIWLESETTFRCPVCRGRVASWAVQSEFTCHHCKWALSSNLGVALRRAVGVGVAVEVLLLFALYWLLHSAGQALNLWLAASCVFGFFSGWLAFRSTLTLRPLRPPRARGTSAPIEQTTPSKIESIMSTSNERFEVARLPCRRTAQGR